MSVKHFDNEAFKEALQKDTVNYFGLSHDRWTELLKNSYPTEAELRTVCIKLNLDSNKFFYDTPGPFDTLYEVLPVDVADKLYTKIKLKERYAYLAKHVKQAMEVKQKMCFEDAYKLMLAGQKVKRPAFKGYWFIDSLDGKVKIVLASGETIEQGDLHTTIANILAEDWEAC